MQGSQEEEEERKLDRDFGAVDLAEGDLDSVEKSSVVFKCQSTCTDQ